MPTDQSTPIGLFGGTFDPPHLGHVALAVEARFRLGLDEVVLVVANDPWQKSGETDITPARLRYEMVAAAVAGHPGLRASDAEISRGGPTYTIDTVAELAPLGRAITLIMGADTAAGLDTWHRATELADVVSVGVANRGPEPTDLDSRWKATRFDLPAMAISSTDVRRRCGAGEPIDHLVPSGALSIIEAHGLYGFRR